MRTYRQYCSMARSLDVIGDRWTLLIVRELLTQGPSRYTDLKRGLPGIATNLLADRLREMELAGLVVRRQAPPPVATALFDLTDRGRDLQGVVRELVRWGGPLMMAPSGSDSFRAHWLVIPLRHLCRDNAPERAPETVRIGTLEDGVDVAADAGNVTVSTADPSTVPSVVVEGPPELLVGLFTGELLLDAAQIGGLALSGNMDALRRVMPQTPTGGTP
jgi:DNA-binding HxlR family transcriptional regulator